MRTIGVGIIGWGFMGKTHAQALRSLPLFYPNAGFEVALRCVCARHLENAEAAARAAGRGFDRSEDRRNGSHRTSLKSRPSCRLPANIWSRN